MKHGFIDELANLEDKYFCGECGEEIIVYDVKNIPETCGKRECDVNHRYRKESKWHDRSSTIPDAEATKKW